MINRFVLVLFLCCFGVFNVLFAAADKTIMITKETDNIPNIQVISINSNETNMKIYKMLVQDLRIIGHFNVYYDDNLQTDLLENRLAMQELKDKNINFVAQISHKKKDSGLIGILTLHDFSSDKRLDLEFSQDEIEKYPFVAHAMANYLNEYIKAEDTSWLNKYIIFSNYVA